MFKKILVPVDLADPEHYRPALEEASKVAKAYDSTVRVVTVVERPPMPTIGYQPRYLPEATFKEILEEAKKLTGQLAKKINASAKKADSIVREGNVYREVLDEAEKWGADLIIMGSHRPRMKTYLLGSNAARIVRHAECSVLVLRH